MTAPAPPAPVERQGNRIDADTEAALADSPAPETFDPNTAEYTSLATPARMSKGENILDNLKGYDPDFVTGDGAMIAADIQEAIRALAAKGAEIAALERDMDTKDAEVNTALKRADKAEARCEELLAEIERLKRG